MLQGKTGLVTGSTSGIGHAIAEALAAESSQIMMNGFGDADEIGEMRATTATAMAVAGNVLNCIAVRHGGPRISVHENRRLLIKHLSEFGEGRQQQRTSTITRTEPGFPFWTWSLRHSDSTCSMWDSFMASRRHCP